jgi:linearmycin/streptolysin S transport system permease protein
MRAALVIAAKDLRQRLRDRSALMIAVVVPLVLASIFGLIFHNAITGRVTFTFGLVDQDHGPAAQAFVTDALGPLERAKLVKLDRESTLAAGRDAANTNAVAATFVLPPGFSSAIQGGQPASVQVLGSVDSTIGTQVAQSVAQSYADRINTVRVARAAARPRAINAAQAAALAPIVVADVSTKNRQLDAGTFYGAGMAIFFLFFTVQFGISSLFDERRDGTLQRMLAAPIRRSAILGGKLITSLVLGLASMTVLAVATRFLLSAHWGNALGIAILILAGVLAATAVMTLVATFAHTSEQAQSWQAMVALVFGMLGGTVFPVAQAGGLLAALSLATPQAWFLRGLDNMAGGAGASAVLGPVAAILTVAVIAGSIAFMRIGRLVGR